MGRGELVKQVLDYLDSTWNMVESNFGCTAYSSTNFEKPMANLRIAKLDDVDDIYQFLMSFPEFVAPYGEKAMIVNRITNNEGIHVLFEENGKIIAHGNSAAKTEKILYAGRNLCGSCI